MEALKRFASLNPALFRGLIVSVISLLALLGVAVTPGLPDALMAVISSLSALIAAVWIRPGVTPNDKVVVYMPDPEGLPATVRPGAAVPQTSDARIITAARHAAPD